MKKPNPHDLLTKAQRSLSKKAQIPSFRVGDTVRVFVKVKEGEKTRSQAYEGLVIRKRNSGAGASFTVRKVSYGVGVERIFPFASPVIDRVQVISHGEVRRAKLYYLRALSGRASRIKSEMVFDTGASTSSSSGENSSEPAEAKAAAQA